MRRWILGLDKKRIAALLTIVFIIHLLLNSMVYFGIRYLEENKNLRFGYRLESTDYHENTQLHNVFPDSEGYTKISTESTLDENYQVVISSKVERYDLSQNLQWTVDLPEVIEPQNIIVSPDVIVETGRIMLYSSDDNIKGPPSRSFYVYDCDNVSVKTEFRLQLNVTYNHTLEFEFLSFLSDPGLIVGDYYANIEWHSFEQFDPISQDRISSTSNLSIDL